MIFDLETIPVDNLEPMIVNELDAISMESFGGGAWKKAGLQPLNIKKLLGLPGVTLFVGKSSALNRICGFAIGTRLTSTSRERFGLSNLDDTDSAYYPQDGDYHLTWRAVLPIYRRAGLGSALTEVRVQYAKDQGAINVLGETIGMNIGTIAMHHCMGFKVYWRSFHLSRSGLFERCYFRKQFFC